MRDFFVAAVSKRICRCFTKAVPMATLPPLRKLQYVLAVARALHFRKAAEALHVSQPAISRQIKEYEEELGFEILQRDHHFVSLTKAGHFFVAGIENNSCPLGKRLRGYCAALTCNQPGNSIGIRHCPFAICLYADSSYRDGFATGMVQGCSYPVPHSPNSRTPECH